MDHKAVTEQLEAYVLGTLDVDERQAVEQHLAGCAECRRLAADLAAAVDLLPLALAAASPLQPPAELRRRVLSAIPEQAPVSTVMVAGSHRAARSEGDHAGGARGRWT